MANGVVEGEESALDKLGVLLPAWSTLEEHAEASTSSQVEDLPASLDQLPDDVLKAILLSLAMDDYHMVTLPMVCTTFQRVCSIPSVQAARLASRLRQVAELVRCPVAPPLKNDINRESWVIGHLWGALRGSDLYLQADAYSSDRFCWLQSNRGLPSLEAICLHCSHLQPEAFTPVQAEALYYAAETARASRIPLPRAEHSSGPTSSADAAAARLGAKLGINYGGSRAAVSLEAQQQAQRQHAASCRRQWKLLNSRDRKAWELKAATANDKSERHLAASATCAREAKQLLERIREHADGSRSTSDDG